MARDLRQYEFEQWMVCDCAIRADDVERLRHLHREEPRWKPAVLLEGNGAGADLLYRRAQRCLLWVLEHATSADVRRWYRDCVQTWAEDDLSAMPEAERRVRELLKR